MSEYNDITQALLAARQRGDKVEEIALLHDVMTLLNKLLTDILEESEHGCRMTSTDPSSRIAEMSQHVSGVMDYINAPTPEIASNIRKRDDSYIWIQE